MPLVKTFSCLALLALIATHSAHAADEAPDDADALTLADKAPAEKAEARSWRLYVEGGIGRRWQRDPASDWNASRGAIDFRYDDTLAPGLRAVLSNRYDVLHDFSEPGEESFNSLREAYLSWQYSPELNVDAGRINLRYGSAWGFNPTDFFKANALRVVVLPDPTSLRENRQGTVALQMQQLWADSAVSAAYSPRLDRTPSDSTFSLDLGSTNDRNRWLLAASHKFGERFAPQALLYGGEDTPVQLGLNASGLLGSATVAFAEFSIGKGRTLIDQALAREGIESTRGRGAMGLTYTTEFNLSVTAEADYSSAAPDRAQWDALGPMERLQFLATAQSLQELPVRHAAFLHATWKDVVIRQLDLTGFVRFDTTTHSRSQWLELRHRWDRVEAALQCQLYSGNADTLFGAVPQHRMVEFSLRFFL